MVVLGFKERARGEKLKDELHLALPAKQVEMVDAWWTLIEKLRDQPDLVIFDQEFLLGLESGSRRPMTLVGCGRFEGGGGLALLEVDTVVNLSNLSPPADELQLLAVINGQDKGREGVSRTAMVASRLIRGMAGL